MNFIEKLNLDNITIIKPGEDVPEEIANFSGRWEGYLAKRGIGAAIIVEVIGPEKAHLTYCWDENKDLNSDPGYLLVEATVIQGDQPGIEWDSGPRNYRLNLGTEANSIVFTSATSKGSTSTVLYKKRDAVYVVDQISSRLRKLCTDLGTVSETGLKLDTIDPVVRFEIEPQKALINEPIFIRAAGFEPAQNVTLRVCMTDDDNQLWASEATFIADNGGTIDLHTQKPLSGGYDNIDGMGLFWSMSNIPATRIESSFVRSQSDPFQAHLIAEIDRKVVAAQTFPIYRNGPDTVELPIKEGGIEGILIKPADADPQPGIITLSGSEGGLGFLDHARFLAKNGFTVLSLAYFNYGALPSDLGDIPLEYFEAAIAWMQSQESVDKERIGAMGLSRGGELVLQLGSMFPQLKAIVAYVPGHVRFWAEHDGPTWTYKGKPLDYIPFQLTPEEINTIYDKAPYNTTPQFLGSINNATNAEKAVIPVENTNGPVLLFSGEDDCMWPSTFMSEKVIERLKQHNHPFSFRHISYKDAGHEIYSVYLPNDTNAFHPVTGMTFLMGGTHKGNAYAAIDSLTKTLEFFNQSLKST